MTSGHIYQHGVKAYLGSKLLNHNPYDRAIYPEAHDAWENGWLDACRSRRRLRAFELVARAYANALQSA